MKYKKELGFILLIALLLRLGPVLLYGMPISYDAPFHIRNAQIIKGAGIIPLIDYSLGSRPNNYPPLYHLLLAEISLLTGLGVELIAMILLPIISVLVVLSVFVLVRKVGDERKAIICSLLVAIASPLIAAAYDSPENIVFLLLPLVLLLYANKSFKLGSLLYASSILWNYFITIITLPPLIVVYWKEKNFLKYLGAGLGLIILFQLFTRGFAFLSNKSLATAMQFITINLSNVMPSLIFVSVIFFLPLMLIALKQKLGKEAKFCIYWNCISFISLISFFLSPILRAWEQLKFLALSSIMLIGFSKERLMDKFVIIFAAFLLITSVVTACQVVFPRINKLDLNAIKFVEEANRESDGTILAAPSLAEYFRIYTALDPLLLTSLYFENVREDSFLADSLRYLSNDEALDEDRFVKESNLQFIITNFEDSRIRGTDFLGGKTYLNKIYSLEYHQNCPFFFLPPTAGYDCGWVKTQIFSTTKK